MLKTFICSDLLFDKPIYTYEELTTKVEQEVFKDLFSTLTITEDKFSKFFKNDCTLNDDIATKLIGKLNSYETRLMYNYLESILKTHSENITTVATKAENDYYSRNFLREISQKLMYNNPGLPSSGTNPLMSSFKGAVVYHYLSDNILITLDIFEGLQVNIDGNLVNAMDLVNNLINNTEHTLIEVQEFIKSIVWNDSNITEIYNKITSIEELNNIEKKEERENQLNKVYEKISESAFKPNSTINNAFGIGYTQISEIMKKYSCSLENAKIIYEELLSENKYSGVKALYDKIANKSISNVKKEQLRNDLEYFLSERAAGEKTISLEELFLHDNFIEEKLQAVTNNTLILKSKNEDAQKIITNAHDNATILEAKAAQTIIEEELKKAKTELDKLNALKEYAETEQLKIDLEYILSEKVARAKIISLEELYSHKDSVEEKLQAATNNTLILKSKIEDAQKIITNAHDNATILEAEETKTNVEKELVKAQAELDRVEALKRHVEELIIEEQIRIMSKNVIVDNTLIEKYNTLIKKYNNMLNARKTANLDEIRKITNVTTESFEILEEKLANKKIALKMASKSVDNTSEIQKLNREIKEIENLISIKTIQMLQNTIDNSSQKYETEISKTLSLNEVNKVMLLRATAYSEMLLECYNSNGYKNFKGVTDVEMQAELDNFISKMDERSIAFSSDMTLENFWQIRGVKKGFRPSSDYLSGDFKTTQTTTEATTEAATQTIKKIEDWKRESYFSRFTEVGLKNILDEMKLIASDSNHGVVRFVGESTYNNYILDQSFATKDGRKRFDRGETKKESFFSKRDINGKRFSSLEELNQFLATDMKGKIYECVIDISSGKVRIGLSSGNEAGASIFWIPGGRTLNLSDSTEGGIDMVLTHLNLDAGKYKLYFQEE